MKRIVVIAIQHPEYPELYLHGKRKDSGKLAMPGGHCEKDEDIKKAAARELKEETGCSPSDLKHLSTTVITKDDGRKMEVNLFSASFKDELHIPHNNEDPDNEFSEYEWVDPTCSKNLHVRPKDNVLIHHINSKLKKSDEICMPTKDVISEHEKLVNILKNPTKEKLQEEAKEQSVELKGYKKKAATQALIRRRNKSLNKSELRKDQPYDIADELIPKVPTMDRGDLAWHAENESSPKLLEAIYNHLVQSGDKPYSVLSGLARNNSTPDDVVRNVVYQSLSMPEDSATGILLNTARRHELPEDLKARLVNMPHNKVQAMVANRTDLSDHHYDVLANTGDRWVHDSLIGNGTANRKPHVIRKILDRSNDGLIIKRAIRGGLHYGALSQQEIHKLAQKHSLKDHPKLIGAIAEVDGVLPETLEHIINNNEIDPETHRELLQDLSSNEASSTNVHRKLLDPSLNPSPERIRSIAQYSKDPQLLHEIINNHIASDSPFSADIVTRGLANPNTSADTIRHIKEKDPDYHYLNNKEIIASHPNVPHDILKEIASDPEMDEATAYRLLSRDDIHPEISETLDKNPSKSLKKERDKAGYGTLVHTSLGTNKLRQARDMAEAQPDKRVHINDLKQAGIHPSDLGFMHLKEKGDKFHADKLHEHIQNQPKMSFGVSHTTYGEEPDITSEEAQWDAHAENFDPSDYYVNKEDFLDTDAAREYHMEQFDPDRHVDRDDPKYHDEAGNFLEDEYDADVESARVGHDQDFDPDDYRHLVYEDDNYVKQREYDRAHERAYDQHLDNFQPSGKSEEDAYNDALREQRHTHEPSKVFQLNVTPQHKAQMKKEGVLDTFNRMVEASKHSSHPVHDNTIGWARYTENPDGIHIDEIQSDFGQSFLRQASQQAKSAAQRGELTPEQAEQAVKDASKKYPDEHFQKISQILFGGKHPNEVIHEAFLQHHRDSGKVGTPVHIWQPESKAPISGMKTHEGVTLHDIKNHLEDPSKGSSAAKSWIKENKIKDLEHAKVVFDQHAAKGNVNTFGEVQVKKPLPGHMQATYGQQPAKMGYKPSEYGKLQTQHNPDLKGQPTWESVIRKKERYFAYLAKNLCKNELSGNSGKLRPKAPAQAAADAKRDVLWGTMPKPEKRKSPIAIRAAQQAAKAKARELLGKAESLEKAEAPPRKIGDLHPTKPYIAKRHLNGQVSWYYTPEKAKQIDDFISQNKASYIAKFPQEHQQVVKNFIDKWQKHPTRHAVMGGDRDANVQMVRARHLRNLIEGRKDLTTGQPYATLQVHGPNKLTFSADRHGDQSRVDHWTHELKGMAKNDDQSGNGKTVFKGTTSGDSQVTSGQSGSGLHVGRVHSVHAGLSSDRCLRKSRRSRITSKALRDNERLKKSGPDEDQGPIRRFKNQTELEHHLSNNPFVMISAHSYDRTPDENQKAHRNLVQDVLSRGYKFTPVLGRWNQSDEPSLMVHDMSEEDARELARKYGQYAHLQSEKGVHRDTSHSPRYKAMKPGKGHIIDNNLQDNYSIVELGDGSHAKFQLNLDNFDTPDKP